MKGIILSGGSGTRLRPLTKVIPKPLLPVYDKPMIFYPLSLLMTAGVQDIMIITTERDLGTYRDLLGDGSSLGIHVELAVQKEPNGIAEALLIAEDFTAGDDAALVLGDNILYGPGVSDAVRTAAGITEKTGHAVVFGYRVDDPRAFGVVGFDETGKPVSLTEKPAHPESDYAVIGVYFYDGRAAGIAKTLTPSGRGELEITDVNKAYLGSGDLELVKLGEEAVWFDAGTFDSLVDAAESIRKREAESGDLVACPEAIAYRNGWIGKTELLAAAEAMHNSEYGKYLLRLAEEDA